MPGRWGSSQPGAGRTSWTSSAQSSRCTWRASRATAGRLAAPSVKLNLAALRMLFDWLVVGQVIPMNPASSVRGPRHSVRKGKTPVLAAEEARALLDAVDVSTLAGLRDRALVGLMVYRFARVGAAISMRVEDVYVQGRRTWIRVLEKGGKVHEMPCQATSMSTCTPTSTKRSSRSPKGWLFRSAVGRTGQLSTNPMRQADVYRMIARRALVAKVWTKIRCHSFRATGITEYLRNGGSLRSPSKWPTMKARGRRDCTTGGRTRYRSMRSNGSSSKKALAVPRTDTNQSRLS